jgi:hypothetical protein
MAKRPTKQATRIGDEATVRATGKTSAEWYSLFDAEHATLWSHREREGFLRRHGIEQPWWLQAITANYERARGIRIGAETGTSGFEFGLSRTFPISAEVAWEKLTTGIGLEAWAGDGVALELIKGAKQQLGGKRIQIKGITEGVRLRLAVIEQGVPERVFQMSIVPATGGKAAVRFHEEYLPGLSAKKRAEKRWHIIMDEVESVLLS